MFLSPSLKFVTTKLTTKGEVLPRTDIKLYTLPIVLLKEKGGLRGERDRDCCGLYQITPPLLCQISVYHMPSPHREVKWIFFTPINFSVRLYHASQNAHYLFSTPPSISPFNNTEIAQSFLEQQNHTKKSQAKALRWGISEPSFCVRPHKSAPQHSHIMEILKLSKRTDSWKEHKVDISEVF